MGARPHLREAIIRAIGPDACRTTSEIAEATGSPNKSVANACSILVVQEYIERIETGCFRLTTAGRAIAAGASFPAKKARWKLEAVRTPRDNTFRQRAWSAMRMSRRFSAGDIAALAANERDTAPEVNLLRWFAHLTRAGYLVELPHRIAGTAPSSNGYKCWKLVRDTGPVAPLVRANGSWHDHNTGEGSQDLARSAPSCAS